MNAKISFSGVATLALLLFSAGADAQIQSKDEQKCINGLAKSGGKVATTAARNFSDCVVDAITNRLPVGQTAADCVLADSAGKLGKAKIKVVDAAAKCSDLPDFGPLSTPFLTTTVINTAYEDILLIDRLFGADLDGAILDTNPEAYCQGTIAKSFGKLLKTELAVVARCIKDGLKDGVITGPIALADCLDDLDTNASIQDALAKAQDTADDACSTADISQVMPGDCALSPSASLYDCLAPVVDCGVCLAVDLALGMSADCDLIDNDAADLSCIPPPPDYTAGPVSFVDTVDVPATTGGPEDGPTCCKDFGAISRDAGYDNALAKLAQQLGGFGQDVEDLLNQAIQDGAFVLLLDHQDLDAGSLPDDFQLVPLLGEFDVGTTYAEASAGTGEFLIARASFLEGTNIPLADFPDGTIDATSMDSGDGAVNLLLPLGFVTLSLPIDGAQVTGDHGGISESGLDYANGKISGYITLDDFFAQLNNILNSTQCDCLGLTSDLYKKNINGSWSATCKTDADTLCTEPSEEVCVALADTSLFDGQVCSALPFFLNSAADIDTNGNTESYEALSVGLEFTGVPGTVTGFGLP